jgi:hypothetical protein
VNMSGILVTKMQNIGISSMTINRSVKGLGQTIFPVSHCVWMS